MGRKLKKKRKKERAVEKVSTRETDPTYENLARTGTSEAPSFLDKVGGLLIIMFIFAIFGAIAGFVVQPIETPEAAALRQAAANEADVELIRSSTRPRIAIGAAIGALIGLVVDFIMRKSRIARMAAEGHADLSQRRFRDNRKL